MKLAISLAILYMLPAAEGRRHLGVRSMCIDRHPKCIELRQLSIEKTWGELTRPTRGYELYIPTQVISLTHLCAYKYRITSGKPEVLQ